MAHVWIWSEEAWQARVIQPGEAELVVPLLTATGEGTRPLLPAPRIKRFVGPDGKEEWLLIAPPRRLRLNGILDALGFRLLEHKDEIRLPGEPSVFFSTERLPRVEKFPGAAHPVVCGRCRDTLAPNVEAVACPNPGCKTWHHRQCWEYTTSCSHCAQLTRLDAGFAWVPEQEERE